MSKLQLIIKNYFESKSNRYLVIILLLGLFLRVYGAKALFLYGHDQDLAGWFVKDVIDNRHFRLIGQETSTQGIFIGPLYYYLLIPFYLLTGLDPIGGVVFITFLGMFSIWSFYYVFAKVFDKRTGLIASLLYAVSFYTVFNDREVVPTMPVIPWSVWFFYALNLLLKGKQKIAYTILGVLIGLIWHLNMTLVLLIPLIVVAQYLSKKKVEVKSFVLGMIIAIVFSLPFIAFELRHNFLQTKALYFSMTTDQQDIISGVAKLKRVVHLASKNISGFVWGDLNWLSYETLSVLLLTLFVVLVARKVISKNLAILMTLWLVIYVAFFSLYSKILSEYYLNGMGIFFITVVILGIAYIISLKSYKKLGLILLVIFAATNIYRFISLPINRSGYVERKATVAEIKKDAKEKDFPCVSVSYITEPGYEFGYRYFFWQEDMHVNFPDSNSPVYTIVFPLRDDIEVHKVFGAIGLIYPDYSRYTKEEVLESCSGENSNVTDPMWGFTN